MGRLRRRLITGAGGAALLLVLGAVAYVWHLDRLVREQFEGRRWDVPAKVYAAPTELYAGAPYGADDLERELRSLHYRPATAPGGGPGTYRRRSNTIELEARRARFAEETRAATHLVIECDGGSVRRLGAAEGELPLFRLDPLLIGSIFPIHGEDRLVLRPDEVPPLLVATLKLVEDRRFDEHHGIDPKGLLRALLVDLRARRIEQGGSTLTQQLVKSYFLDSRQTLTRKLNEAIMSLSLERRFSKADILTAYVNEIYLGQDGERAIHGFGLAAEFYFGKPVAELDLAETALLVGLVRGPSYYDPHRHPERARERRDLVLRLAGDAGLVPPAAAQEAAKRALGLHAASRGNYVPAYLDLVRRSLKRDYQEADLAAAGLAVYTSLDPRAQAAAERALTRQLARLDGEGLRKGAPLQGAVVVSLPASGDVVAVVGGRSIDFDGFDRALDARRPIGSLVKPVVYLAALESGRYTAATLVDDSPVDLKLPSGEHWTPQNFTRENYGPVPVVHALAESLNLATVHVGLDVGLPKVAAAFERLLPGHRPEPHPSLLLGAVELTPLEVAALYTSLANGGFESRVQAVRAVLAEDGKPLKRFPISLRPVASSTTVFALDAMMTEVLARGTARAAGARFLPRLVLAGKTGTSSDLRDSWFAGFSATYLVVAWVGYDDNRPTGLTGASGALPVWSDTMATLRAGSFDPPIPEGLEWRYVDFWTGAESAPSCGPDAVRIALPKDLALPQGACAGRTPPPAQPPGPTLKQRALEILERLLPR
jgi:penicillin-binding protein 1B